MCVLHKEKPQQELANGVVKLPFGSEYALRFRNKNNRRAVVKFFIDGENVSGPGYIVNANSYVDIKRHFEVDRSFKFVSLESPEAIDFGKNGPNKDKTKGVIEARFYLEKENRIKPTIPIYRPTFKSIDSRKYSWLPEGAPFLRGQFRPMSMCDGVKSITSSCTKDLESCQLPLSDGCTVEGAATGQSWTEVTIEIEETYTTLKLFLQGYEENTKVAGTQFNEDLQNLEPLFLRKEENFNESNEDLTNLESENERLRLKIEEIKSLKKQRLIEEKQNLLNELSKLQNS